MRIVAAIVTGIFLLGAVGPDVNAVEKKEKKARAKVEEKKPEKKAGAEKSKEADKKSLKKYDDFIDRNGNGIDDRKEKLVPKKSSKAESDKKTVDNDKATSDKKKTDQQKKADDKK